MEKNKDHRQLGIEMDLFFIDPFVGKGFPIWLPNGLILKNKIRDFIIEQEKKYNFELVETPVIGSVELYKKSGHYDHYKENIFPIMKLDEGEEFVLRPMACPHHIMIYKHKLRSYKNLPIRLAEQVYQFRYESSGGLLGLERVRAMNLTDSHIFLRDDQIEQEIENAFNIVKSTLEKFNINIDYIELALHDPKDKEKYHQDDEKWRLAEQSLKNFLENKNIKYISKIGEAAFYGPKIDIQIKTKLNHIITLSTIQLDFVLPEKFDIFYVDKNLNKKRPIMIHRGLIGTYERFISVLLEQTQGDFPLWLAPIQVAVVPVSKYQSNYANEIYNSLIDNNIRAILDDTEERLSNKIRILNERKVKIQLIVGENEERDGKVSCRLLGKKANKIVVLKDILNLFK
ncbi:MAG: hypothetical protein HPAVJP_1180 [Candidatus Hepatoplasma vulgare]|nr:MAG: hypothetical protein HPAVJP_1180 [Candidatus Hepatoplasma sp.]